MTGFTRDEILGSRKRTAKIIVLGKEIEVEAGTEITEIIEKELIENGVQRYSIILNGNPILSAEEIPLVLEENDVLEIVRNIKVGLK